jgi:hypothetical protein
VGEAVRSGTGFAVALLALLTSAPAARAQVLPDTASADTAAAAIVAAAATAPPSAAAPAGALEPGPGHWFYKGLPYGSDAMTHPLRLIVDGGFGIMQFDSRSNRLDDVHWRRGWGRVWADLEHPARAIEVGGWWDWIEREVLPFSANKRDAQYWPNYTLHLIGGGMTYVMVREWYAQHAVTHPQACAVGTMAVYHLLNEVVENDRRPGPTTDALTDLYVFDPASILLFSHEGVCGFFSRRLHMRDWSSQPAIDPSTGALENQGQNYSIKVAIPRSERWSFFYYFGNHGEGGLSYARSDGSAFSLGAGFQAKALQEIGDNAQTADLVPSYGFFYDRHGSLLFSVTGAKTSRYRAKVNVYPGLLNFRGHTAGLFLAWNRRGETVAGVTVPLVPVGIAGRR